MVMTERVIFAWSGGKDSALALYELQRLRGYEVFALLTTVTKDYKRISMHGVRQDLLERQAECLDFPLEIIEISKKASNEEYESKMSAVLEKYKERGVDSVVFADIFLEDVRKYREDNLSRIGMSAIFPLWAKDTRELAHTFIDLGFEAIITCVDSKILDMSFAGRDFNERFLSELPPNVDPCGENGEFHSFVYDGPIFKQRISFTPGKVVLRDERFYFCDLKGI
jgi:uncharacterized protein (TIGR00290 family)